MINLTETQNLKDAIAQNPEDYKHIIEQTELGICITNEQGHYVAVNDNYTQITGYSREELIGESFLKVVPPPKQDDLQEMHDQFIEIQIEIFEKFEIINKSGQLLKIDVDAGFNDHIEGKPHKITFIQLMT